MDPESQKTLARLIRTQRTAALGTLRDGAPFVSMVLFAAAPDFSSFYLHLSRLAHHTQDLLRDSRTGLMIAEAERGTQNPQNLARISILGKGIQIPKDTQDFEHARAIYIQKCPQGAFNFSLGDFELFEIRIENARYVAGFGKIFDLTANDFQLLGFIM
jgi:putative heme iron utilization protein